MTIPDPERTLSLIQQGDYNMGRPDGLLLKELVEVVKYLHERVTVLEEWKARMCHVSDS